MIESQNKGKMENVKGKKKSPETVPAEKGWKEPECPPQAGGRTAAPSPGLSQISFECIS